MNVRRVWKLLLILPACSFGRSLDAPSNMNSKAARGSRSAAASPSVGTIDGVTGGDSKAMADQGEMVPRDVVGSDHQTAPDTSKQQRLLHYNGYAKLRVDAIRKSADAGVAIAVAAGGFVEQISASSVTVRVPVARFKEIFFELLKIGEVVDKSITAQDVTEAFTAIELRLETAKMSRERLIQLLAKARTEREKLDLLREIQRLSLEIEGLESAQKTIASLASMSRITLALEERRQDLSSAADEPIAAFEWIHRLSPFRRDVAFQEKKLEMPLPKGFVSIDDKEHFVAESADGAVMWSSKRDNTPLGTTRFWADALKGRMAPDYAAVEEKQLGEFIALRFVDRGDKPYSYLVAARVDDKKLHIVEAYFPSAEHETRYAQAVNNAITKGKL